MGQNPRILQGSHILLLPNLMSEFSKDAIIVSGTAGLGNVLSECLCDCPFFPSYSIMLTSAYKFV